MEINTTEPIDIYGKAGVLERELDTTQHDERILPANRETIRRFIRDARVGRTIKRGAKRRISETRCRKLLATLRRFAMEIDVPFEKVTVDTMERFIIGMEDGQVLKLSKIGGTDRYRPGTILDFRKIIRKFYRWLLHDQPDRVDELTAWFDMSEEAPELKTFGLAEAERMAQAVGNPQGRALIMLLFDGGFRAGELFNVRLSDVRFQPDAQGRLTCFVRIRVSKTKPRTISLPLASEAVRFWIERHPYGGPIEADGSIAARDPSATLMAWTYHYCRKLITRLGKEELGERLYLHRFRHASATFYAKRLSHYQLTARFGWTMGSRAVQRYIDHSGVLAEEVASVVRRERVEPASFAGDGYANRHDDMAGRREHHSAGLSPRATVQPRRQSDDAALQALVEQLRDRPELAAALKAALYAN